MASFISILFAILLTGFVLAPWYVDQTLSFLSGRGADFGSLILVAATVAVILLLVSGLGRQRTWLKWNIIVGLFIAGVWVVSVIYGFTIVEPDPSRFGPGLIFGLTSLWLPFLAWSLFFDLTWMARFAVFLTLLLAQPLFVVRYRVQQINDIGDMIVVKRSSPYMKAHTKTARHDSRESTNTQNATQPNTSAPANPSPPSAPISEWTLGKNDGADGQLLPGLAPNSLLVEIKDKAKDEPWKLQLIHPKHSFQSDDEVTVSFRARSPKPRPIQVEVSQNHEPWKKLGIDRTVELKPEWQDFTFEGKVPFVENDARLIFGLGGHNTSVEVADVKVSTGAANRTKPSETKPSEPVVASTPRPSNPSAQAVVPAQPVVPIQPVIAPSVTPPSQSTVAPPRQSVASLEGWSIAIEANSRGEVTAKNANQPYWSIKIAPQGSKNDRSVRLDNHTITLHKGKRYELRIRAKSSVPRTIGLNISHPETASSTMGLSQQFELTTNWNNLVSRFEAIGEGPSEVSINLGGTDSVVDVETIELVPMN